MLALSGSGIGSSLSSAPASVLDFEGLDNSLKSGTKIRVSGSRHRQYWVQAPLPWSIPKPLFSNISSFSRTWMISLIIFHRSPLKSSFFSSRAVHKSRAVISISVSCGCLICLCGVFMIRWTRSAVRAMPEVSCCSRGCEVPLPLRSM